MPGKTLSLIKLTTMPGKTFSLIRLKALPGMAMSLIFGRVDFRVGEFVAHSNPHGNRRHFRAKRLGRYGD